MRAPRYCALTADFDARYIRLSGSIVNLRVASGASFGNWTATLANESGGLTGGEINGGIVFSGNTVGAAERRGWSGGWITGGAGLSVGAPDVGFVAGVHGALGAGIIEREQGATSVAFEEELHDGVLAAPGVAHRDHVAIHRGLVEVDPDVVPHSHTQ